jgi:hypothetical protein
LLRAYVACNLLQEALPQLPKETAQAVEEPLAQFCRIVGDEVQKIAPA